MDEQQYFDVISPVNQEWIGKAPILSKEQIQEKIVCAKRAFPDWRASSFSERRQILCTALDWIGKEKAELEKLIIKEVGKSLKNAESEMECTIERIRQALVIAHVLLQEGGVRDGYSKSYYQGKYVVKKWEPLGVILIITPFDYPVFHVASQIAEALLMGNTAVIKPSSNGTLTARYVAELFYRAGVPEEVLQIVTGKGKKIGNILIKDPMIDCISFTGTTEVGRYIREQVSDIPLLMKLGGKDAAIVLEDADLELAAKHIVGNAFFYSGQRHQAVKRVIAAESIHDVLTEKLLAYMEKLVMGNPKELNADIVPLIHQESADFVSELIEDAVRKGAVILTAGKGTQKSFPHRMQKHRVPEQKRISTEYRQGNLLEPMLLDGITNDMHLAWAEQLGPVLPVLTVKTGREAATLVNQSEYSSGAILFSNSIEHALHLAEQLKVDTVQINGKAERRTGAFPYKGRKDLEIGISSDEVYSSMKAMAKLKKTMIHLTIR